VTPGSLRRLRRAAFVALLVALALSTGPVSGAQPCTDRACLSAGRVRWSRPLPGTWVAGPGQAGTVPAQGGAYAALNHGVAAVGIGSMVYAYRSRTGVPRWTADLARLGAGARVVAIRVWPTVVTAGVDVPAGTGGTVIRREVVLSEATGRLLRSFPAAPFGGAVSGYRRHTVIVGNTAVTSYDDASGAVDWNRRTGPAAQAWRRDRTVLYMTVATGGYLSGAPVRELRRIDLRTGAQQLVRPAGRSFSGQLNRVLDGVVVFTDSRGTVGYSGRTGARLWRRNGAVPALSDPGGHLLYLSYGATLTGIDPWSGHTEVHVAGGSAAGTSAFYAARDGVVLGLDPGSQGDAYGYGPADGRVLWTNSSLPWPHFFVDLSGIGGSADPASGGVLLAACGGVGPGQRCLHPELAVLDW
jgi:PQQ-like domain